MAHLKTIFTFGGHPKGNIVRLTYIGKALFPIGEFLSGDAVKF
jgi:hypothetical protein